MTRFAAAFLTSALLMACNPGIEVPRQTLTVACGRCVFELPDAKGCPWAAEFGGDHYFVQSEQLPRDHETHAPDGICNMPRKAVVAGTIKGRILFASEFELLPPTDVPAQPRFTPADDHG